MEFLKLYEHITTPGKDAANPILASEKKIAEPEMIKGIIIGEIKTLIINCLYGIYLLLNPRAAIVPKAVAPIVAKNANKNYFVLLFPMDF
jgi:hypothetical protein